MALHSLSNGNYHLLMQADHHFLQVLSLAGGKAGTPFLGGFDSCYESAIKVRFQYFT